MYWYRSDLVIQITARVIFTSVYVTGKILTYQYVQAERLLRKKGSFSIMNEETVTGGFWDDPYLQTLTPRGRLALAYVASFIDEGKKVNIEDMAAATNLEYSEAVDYVRLFIRQGKVNQEDIGADV